MNLCRTLAVVLITAGLLGCTHSSSQSVNLALQGTGRNAGQVGRVTLTDMGDKTNFNFYITGVPEGTLLPPRIYTFINKGGCQQPGATAFAMNDKVNTESAAGTKGWTFYRSAPIALSELISGKYSVVVRTAPEDGNLDIFCGEVAQATR